MTKDENLSSLGPPTASHISSSGVPGHGPATLSCSGDGNHSHGSTSLEASVPLTEEGLEVTTQETMGRVRPGPQAQSPYSMRSLDAENNPDRPMITLSNVQPDVMSVLSDSLMDIVPSGEEGSNAGMPSSINRQSRRGSWSDLRTSNTSLMEPVAEKNSFRAANDNTKARQVAVDNMVMAALRQAQEVQENLVGGDKPPISATGDSGVVLHHQIGQPVKPQLRVTSKLVEEMKDLALRQSSSGDGTSASRGKKKKGKKQHKRTSSRNSSKLRNSGSPHSLDRESASRGDKRAITVNVHSFSSSGETTNVDAENTFDC